MDRGRREIAGLLPESFISRKYRFSKKRCDTPVSPMRSNLLSLPAGFLICFLSPLIHSAEAVFLQGLGDLPGGTFQSFASEATPDGSVVVGYSSSSNGYEAFRWTAAGGMVGLGSLGGSPFSSYGNGISADGSIIVGYSRSSSAIDEPFRWTSGTGMVGLGSLPGGNNYGRAFAISANGAVIVGTAGSTPGIQAMYWTSGTGMVGLGDFAGGAYDSYATGVSADGSVIVGSGAGTAGREAFRWTSGTGMVGLGDLSGGTFDSYAITCNSDGGILVGYGTSAIGTEAMMWTAGSGMVGLGTVAGSARTTALDVSDDGNMVVGWHLIGNGQAFVWTPTGGMQNLGTFLVNNYGIDLTGWTLYRANSISDDGRVITGYGSHNGNVEAFIAVIPEPELTWLLTAGLFSFLTRRRLRNEHNLLN